MPPSCSLRTGWKMGDAGRKASEPPGRVLQVYSSHLYGDANGPKDYPDLDPTPLEEDFSAIAEVAFVWDAGVMAARGLNVARWAWEEMWRHLSPLMGVELLQRAPM